MTKHRFLVPLLILSMVASLGLLGCEDSNDDDNGDGGNPPATNAPAGDEEVTLDSKNFQVSDGDVSVTGTETAPGAGTIRAHARWNEGGQMTGVLYKNGAVFATETQPDTPINIAADTAAGDTWKLEVTNQTGKDQDLHMYIYFTPD
jgi:hypothetical protein